MRSLGAYMLREVYDFDCNAETEFWYIIKDRFGGMGELTSKTRNLVRRAFGSLHIEKISYEVLLREGYGVYESAYKHYKDHTMYGMPTEAQYIDNILAHKDRDYWGCFDPQQGKLVAYAINIVHNGMCEYASMKAIPEYLKTHYPYYGLIYKMNEYYLSEVGVDFVSDGTRTITEHSNIQFFLCQKFLFRKAYCKMKMHYAGWFGIAVRLLYPFRKCIPCKPLRNLLKQEYWSRKSH